ncbi:MAG: hypothetical protein ACI4I1_07715 [Oscillospiraceae bacterium]
MKKVLQITSVLCGILALSGIWLGFRSLFSHGYFVSWALFSMTRSGTAMGMLGNIIGIAFTVIGFGAMCYYGLFYKGGKNAFIWGAVMTALSALSLIMSIFGGSFNFGDILLLALAGAYTYSTIKLA